MNLRKVISELVESHLKKSSSPVAAVEFVEIVYQDLLGQLTALNITPPLPSQKDLIEEMKLEVQDVLSKKIYGYYSIQEYREAKKY